MYHYVLTQSPIDIHLGCLRSFDTEADEEINILYTCVYMHVALFYKE